VSRNGFLLGRKIELSVAAGRNCIARWNTAVRKLVQMCRTLAIMLRLEVHFTRSRGEIGRKRAIMQDLIGPCHDSTKQPGRVEVPNLDVTLSEATWASWKQWFDDFVVKGNNDCGAVCGRQGVRLLEGRHQLTCTQVPHDARALFTHNLRAPFITPSTMTRGESQRQVSATWSQRFVFRWIFEQSSDALYSLARNC
jgi:hypothetical protein